MFSLSWADDIINFPSKLLSIIKLCTRLRRLSPAESTKRAKRNIKSNGWATITQKIHGSLLKTLSVLKISWISGLLKNKRKVPRKLNLSLFLLMTRIPACRTARNMLQDAHKNHQVHIMLLQIGLTLLSIQRLPSRPEEEDVLPNKIQHPNRSWRSLEWLKEITWNWFSRSMSMASRNGLKEATLSQTTCWNSSNFMKEPSALRIEHPMIFDKHSN